MHAIAGDSVDRPIQRRLPRWKFALFAIAPLVSIVVGAESLLRVLQFAYNPHDLSHPIFTRGTDGVVRTSDFFARNARFSPAEFCRRQAFRDRKAPKTVRIALLGESSVFHLGRADSLADPLHRQWGQVVEIVNMGVLGCGSERVLWSAAEAIDLDVDLLVIYTGHNEFVSFSHARTYRQVPLGMRLFPRHSRLFQAAWWMRDRASPPRALAEPGANTSRGRDYSTAEIEAIYNDFRANLTATVRLAKAASVHVVLCTVAYNMQLPPTVSRGGFAYDTLTQLSTGELERIVELAPNSAWPHHVLGVRRIDGGRAAEGMEMLERSFVLDPCPMRANARINEIISDVARQADVPLADVRRHVGAAAIGGVPGSDLFRDDCHLNDEGNRLLLGEAAAACLRAWADGL